MEKRTKQNWLSDMKIPGLSRKKLPIKALEEIREDLGKRLASAVVQVRTVFREKIKNSKPTTPESLVRKSARHNAILKLAPIAKDLALYDFRRLVKGLATTEEERLDLACARLDGQRVSEWMMSYKAARLLKKSMKDADHEALNSRQYKDKIAELSKACEERDRLVKKNVMLRTKIRETLGAEHNLTDQEIDDVWTYARSK